MSEELAVRWVTAAGVGLVVWLIGWLVGRILLRRLGKLLHRTQTEIDDLLLAALRPKVPIVSALLGIALGVQQAPVPASARQVVGQGIGVALIFSLSLVAARFLGDLIQHKSSRLSGAFPASTLTQNLVRVVVLGMGLLVIAGQLGIAITPILTALGVGSLAVALALQPTLANFFAGIHISLARQIRVGDFVKLEGDTQGYVQDIGWRSTQIRELPDNLIIVPNARLAEMVVKNYSLPETEQAALVQVGVSYGSDLALVERVTIDVAREALRSAPGGVAAFDPFIRYNAFGDSSINFTVILRVSQFADRYLVSHEFIKLLHRRYAQEGIEIPFPQRVVHLQSDDRTARDRAS